MLLEGVSGWIFKTAFGWIDIPDSFVAVVLSFWLIVAVRTALGYLAVFASDLVPSPSQPKGSAERVSDSDGPDGTRWDNNQGHHCSLITDVYLMWYCAILL